MRGRMGELLVRGGFRRGGGGGKVAGVGEMFGGRWGTEKMLPDPHRLTKLEF